MASDWREALSPSAGSIDGRWVFEEYRYDALGRRVVVLAQRGCRGLPPPWDTECSLSWIRRTVWDGDQELWEVQMPLTMLENDVTPVQLPNGSMQKDPLYGLVGYTNGLALDRPFGFLRVHYASDIGGTGGYKLWQPFTLLPFYDVKGHPENAFISDGSITRCPDDIGVTYHCVRLDWPFEWKAYRGYTQIRRSWHGSMLEDKRDASRTMYRRNRYYDPATGRFTQEDPIGLAGGLNLYGFANGDPVNFSDPFGLFDIAFGDEGTKALVESLRKRSRTFDQAIAKIENDHSVLVTVGQGSTIPCGGSGGCTTATGLNSQGQQGIAVTWDPGGVLSDHQVEALAGGAADINTVLAHEVAGHAAGGMSVEGGNLTLRCNQTCAIAVEQQVRAEYGAPPRKSPY